MTQPPFSGNDFFDQIDSVARNLTGNAFRLKRNDPTAPQKRNTRRVGSSEYNGKTYYFCSQGCKGKFDANPAQYPK